MMITTIPKSMRYDDLMKIVNAAKQQAQEALADMFACAQKNDKQGFDDARGFYDRAMVRVDAWSLAAANHAANAALDDAQAAISTLSEVSHDAH